MAIVPIKASYQYSKVPNKWEGHQNKQGVFKISKFLINTGRGLYNERRSLFLHISVEKEKKYINLINRES